MSTAGILIEVPGAGSGTVTVQQSGAEADAAAVNSLGLCNSMDFGDHSIFGPTYREGTAPAAPPTTRVQFVEQPLGGINPMTGAGQMSLVEMGKRLLIAARDGDAEEVAFLIRKGAPFTNDWLGTAPIHLAAAKGCVQTCDVLIRSGNAKDSRTKVDKTPLHIAAQEGHADVIELLLKNGAEIDATDMLKMTPLHWAVERGNIAAVEMLLRFGADPNALSKFDKSPLEVASDNGRPDIFEMLQNSESFRQQGIDSNISDAVTMAATNSILEHSVMGDIAMGETVHGSQHASLPLPLNLPKTVQASNSAAAMKLFEAHGIKMLPEDSGPSPLETNMRNGTKTFTLTEAGKRALNLPSSITVNRTAKLGGQLTQAGKTMTQRIVSTNGQKITKVIKLADGTTKPLSSLTGGGIVKTESGKKIFISAEQVAKIRARSQGLSTQNVTLAGQKPSIIRTVPASTGQKIVTSSAGGGVKKTVKIIRVNSQGGIKTSSVGGTPIVVRPSPASMSSAGKPTIITVNSSGKTVRPTMTSFSTAGDQSGKPRTVIVSASSPAAAVAAASGVVVSKPSTTNVVAAAAAAASGIGSDADDLKRKLDEALKALARVSEENKELKKLQSPSSQEN